MGYVHLTDICQFIPPSMVHKKGGEWTATLASNLFSDVRTAGTLDTEFELFIPLVLPGSDVALQGAKIVSIDIWYKIATAAATDFSNAEIKKVTLPANATAATGAAVTCAIDADHDTAAERKTVASHKMTITLTTPVFVEDDVAYYVYLKAEAAATTVFSIVGAQVNYILRL